jgi:uncharacterized protein with von Willebrand factor type A (vWA) domain
VAVIAEDITMSEPVVYLEKLSAFSGMLRMEGLSVSPKETADACQILIRLGMDDREQVKTALRTVYAKSREEQLAFDQVFDGFFISEEKMRKQAEEKALQEQQMRENIEALQKMGQAENLTEEQQYAYASLPAEERERPEKLAQ